MGLDAVELVMEVEDAFGIEISDNEAQGILTVGDLFECLKLKAELAPAGTCLTASTFYDLKRALNHGGITDRFGPSSKLVDILPSEDRRMFWLNLAAKMEMRLPNLVRSSAVTSAITASTIIASLTCGFWIWDKTGSADVTAVATLLSGVAVLVLTSFITRPLATHFDTDFKTFRGFSERLLALNASKQRSKHGPMGSNDLWTILRGIIVEQLGVDRDEVVPEARFVQDLGLD